MSIFADIVIDCAVNKVELKLTPTEQVFDQGIGSSGYFDAEPPHPKLYVATGKPYQQWVEVLLHEWSHMQQWKEGLYIENLTGEMWDWLNGQDIDMTLVRADVRAHLECEIDCEKRTVNLIKQNPGLGINIDEYIKKANAYLFFYEIVHTRRKWYSKPPYENQQLLDMMPTTILETADHYRIFPVGYEQIVERDYL